MKTPNDLWNKFLNVIGNDVFGKVKILDTVNTNLTNEEIDVNITNTNLNIIDTNSDDYKIKNGKKFMVSGYATSTYLNIGMSISNSVGKKIKVNTKFLMTSSCDIFVNKNSTFLNGTPGVIVGYQKDNIQNGLPTGLDIVLKYNSNVSLNPTGITIYRGYFATATQNDNDFNQEFILNPGEQITIYGISTSSGNAYGTFELDIEIID